MKTDLEAAEEYIAAQDRVIKNLKAQVLYWQILTAIMAGAYLAVSIIASS